VPITVTEKFDSRPAADGDNPSAELKYVVEGTGDEQQALAALESDTPASCGRPGRWSPSATGPRTGKASSGTGR